MSVIDGTLTLTMPFEEDGDFRWPFLSPRQDSGKYIMGLFEGGESANGVHVHAVSVWTCPKDLVAATSNETGHEVLFKTVDAETYTSMMPQAIAGELTETDGVTTALGRRRNSERVIAGLLKARKRLV